MLVAARALTYSALFIGILLLYVPRTILGGGAAAPPIDTRALIAMVVGGCGALVALWSILTFVVRGRGTPAPFDPPRLLVVRGPYRFVRNPMYIGADIALAAAAFAWNSWPLLAYVAVMFVMTHVFVITYEEPTLRRTFGADYDRYCVSVRRWLPGTKAFTL